MIMKYLFALILMASSVAAIGDVSGGQSANLGFFGATGTQNTAHDIWIGVRSDGQPGDGTAIDPYDGSTSTKFDSVMLNNTHAGDSIHLLSGTFLTKGCSNGISPDWPNPYDPTFIPVPIQGWYLKPGQTIDGAGMYATTIKQESWPLVSGSTLWPYDIAVIANLNGPMEYSDRITISNLEIDCNYRGLSGIKPPHVAMAALSLAGDNHYVHDVRCTDAFGDNECFALCIHDVASIAYFIGHGYPDLGRPTNSGLQENNLLDSWTGRNSGCGCGIIVLTSGGAAASGVIRNCRVLHMWPATGAFAAPVLEGCYAEDCSAFAHHDTVNLPSWHVYNCIGKNLANGLVGFETFAGEASGWDFHHNKFEINLNRPEIGLYSGGGAKGFYISATPGSVVGSMRFADNLITTTGSKYTMNPFAMPGIAGLQIVDNVVDSTGVSLISSPVAGRVIRNNRTLAGATPAGLMPVPVDNVPTIGNFASGLTLPWTSGTLSASVSSFGIPAINDLGEVAVQAEVTGTSGSDLMGNDNSGIWVFSGTKSTLIAYSGLGSPAAGILDKLGDPVFNNEGEVAFFCKVKGSGFNSKNSQQIWASTLGGLHCVAQNRGNLDPLDLSGTGVKAASFQQIVLPDQGGVVFLANLVNAAGGTTAATNQGIWMETQGGLKQLIRKGDILASGTISAFSLFGSPLAPVGDTGQTRSFNSNGDLCFKAILTNGRQGIFLLSSDAVISQVAFSGSSAPFIFGAPAKFGVLGNPILNDNGNTAFRAFLLTGAGKTAAKYSAILTETYSSNPLGIVAITGSSAPDAIGLSGSLGTFASLGDPVFNANDHVAFLGTLRKGGGVTVANRQGIWANTSGTLALVARAQGQAPGCPIGSKFLSFSQLVLPEHGGVVFLASLTGATGGVNRTNNRGIWAADTSGNLRLLARKSDVLTINGSSKIVSALSLFSSSKGTTGQTRSFNQAGDLIYKVTFTDKTQAIQRMVLP